LTWVGLFPVVDRLIDEHIIPENQRIYFPTETQVIQEKQKYLQRWADLYLVAYCIEVQNDGGQPMLVSDEEKANPHYQKLIQKIPDICCTEGIPYLIPNVLFNHYQTKLKFDLQVMEEVISHTSPPTKTN
jgi:hypothetical protein